jgi:hypothetical protein
MVKEIINKPQIIGLTPSSIAQPLAQTGNNLLSDLDGYIKLIEKAITLFDKIQAMRVQQPLINTKPINNEIVDLGNMPKPSKQLIDNDKIDNKDDVMNNINIDFILGVLEQIDTMQKGITVRELIDFIHNNQDTVNNLIKMNMPKEV